MYAGEYHSGDKGDTKSLDHIAHIRGPGITCDMVLKKGVAALEDVWDTQGFWV